MNKIWGKQIGGHWLEAIKQGDFSVDSFLFIGMLSLVVFCNKESFNPYHKGPLDLIWIEALLLTP